MNPLRQHFRSCLHQVAGKTRALQIVSFIANFTRIVIINLHPAFSKPAGHRAMEVLENEKTGKQEFHRHIKVSKYLNVAPVKSEALRGQPYPLVCVSNSLHAVKPNRPELVSSTILVSVGPILSERTSNGRHERAWFHGIR